MPSSRFEIHPGALESFFTSPQSRAYKFRQGRKIADAWRSQIHRVTGATDRSIEVTEEQRGEVIVEASTSRDPNSAWLYLEYGTADMRARHPGRRAINGVRD